MIEFIIMALMAAVMQVLGTRFDDGGNMDLGTYQEHVIHYYINGAEGFFKNKTALCLSDLKILPVVP